MPCSLRLGVLRLTDSAPVVLAESEGLFAAEGVEVAIQVEPSWANIADKLRWGALDAAVMPLPLALAAAAGLRGPATRLIVPMGISRGGNAVVVSSTLVTCLPEPLTPAAAPAFRAWLRDQTVPPRVAVVHLFSTHNLLLRYWLGSVGVDPDRDLEIVVIPPERVVAELTAGRIAGFCAGAPWGDVAEATGSGRILLGSSSIRPRHTEKCLALAGDWAADHPGPAAALSHALQAAQRLCDQPERSPAVAALLARRLDLPEEVTPAALPGGNGIEQIAFAAAAPLDPAEGLWFLREMRRWRWLGVDRDLEQLVADVYRSHLPLI
ncbi:MAG TPA: CmpA/NrtA family ABC transporter substrate-binding protein [Acetobacteraceae bacterium]|jgi:ABC-type nitrate/sulfonate/bicarbonate transport system substrate-binding protein|nr:CmpA/NrtA family ABC transporter substrate-binding protein [Acetobacteraceae bacterium]